MGLSSRIAVLSYAKDVCLEVLRPSIWAKTQRAGEAIKPTAWLDGLRGFAALLVYCLHHQGWAHGDKIMENAYGYDKEFYFACLPGVRIFFSGGHFAVAVFFVISGYVLSLKALTLIHARETLQLADKLGSHMFRRWLRLFVPVIGTTFIWMTTWHLFGIKSSNPITHEPAATYAKELWRWYAEFKNFSFIFHQEPLLLYNDHVWSIAFEFRGSIVVFTTLLAFSRCTRNARLWLEAGLMFYFLYVVDGWYCALFAAGMLFCDLDLLASKDNLPDFLYFAKSYKSYVFHTLLFVGLYLGGVPSIADDVAHLRKSPGWYYLSLLKPQAVFDFRWFYRFWAAALVVPSISQIPSLKSFFEWQGCQYLGKISYTFYLVHGPILWTVGDRIYAAVGRVRTWHSATAPTWINVLQLPNIGPYGLEINFLMAQIVLFPMTLWCAEIATNIFDTPSVKLSNWLYNKILDSDDSPDQGHRRQNWEKV